MSLDQVRNLGASDVLVLLPRGRPYYPVEEGPALLKNLQCLYVSDSDAFRLECTSPVKCITVPYRAEWLPTRKFEIANAVIPNLREIIWAVRPKFIVTHEIFSSLSFQVARIRKRTGPRFKHIVVCYETTSRENGLWGSFPVTRLFSNEVVKSADLCVALSKCIRQSLCESGVNPHTAIEILPGLFPNEFPVSPIPPGDRDHVVLFIGALRENKGLRVLIQALQLLNRQKSEPIELRIAGRGPLENYVNRSAAHYHWLTYVGQVRGKQRLELLHRSRLFAYPSVDVTLLGKKRWEEQVGFSLIEAMAVGLPAIASNSGSLPEILGRSDVIVPQSNAEALASRIGSLLNSPEAMCEIGEYNRRRVLTELNVTAYATRLEEALLAL